MRILESAEDYLERILILQEKNGSVRSIDIANDMSFSKPSVSIAMKKLKENNYWVIATEGNSKDNYYDIDYTNSNFVIVMGAEQKGISRTVLKQADYTVKLPMLNNFDSLNVANAASIIMYEAVKQNIQNCKNVV